MNQYEQALLDLAGPVPASFDTFHHGPNRTTVDILKTAASSPEQWIYLTGDRGSGRTHLLLAACAAAREADHQALYLGLKQTPDNLLQHLDSMANCALLALDDVDAIAGNEAWEEAIFHLLNQLRAAGRGLIMSAAQNPGHAGFHLPDLRSRLSWGQIHRLKPLQDEDIVHVLHIHAQAMGLPLADNVIRYLLTHTQRNTKHLLKVINRLQKVAFAAKKKPSVALASQVINDPNHPVE